MVTQFAVSVWIHYSIRVFTVRVAAVNYLEEYQK